MDKLIYSLLQDNILVQVINNKKVLFLLQPNTTKISMRARGRQAKIRVATSTAGTSWRYGTVRLDIGQMG